MRWFGLALLVLVVACGEDQRSGDCTYMGQTYPAGAIWPAGDGCNTCHCSAELGVECTLIACPDANPAAACGPGGGCPSGPACGLACCGSGERCDYNNECRCGTGDPCGPGDSCEAFGPAACGSICCGASGPCPQ